MKGIEIIETIPASRGIKMQVPLFAICLLFLFLTYICIRKSHSIIGIIVAIILAIITTIYTISLTHIHKEQYIIKIHDDASYNEFTIKYRIIQKQGNVYTVEEKEDK